MGESLAASPAGGMPPGDPLHTGSPPPYPPRRGKPRDVSCGADYVSCGADYVSCGADYVSCGADYVPCGCGLAVRWSRWLRLLTQGPR